MITIYKNKQVSVVKGTGDSQLEFRGLSTDNKPLTYNDSDIPNGAIFIEMDTGKFYMFDLQNKAWKEI